MKCHRFAVASLVLVALASPAAADDSGNFIYTLGQDTTSVEHYTRTPARLEVHQVGRAPRVLQRHMTYDYTKGAISRVSVVVMPPGATTPTQTIDATVGPDSMRMQIQNGTAPPQKVSIAVPPGTLVLAYSSPWAGYEGQVMKLVQGKADSLRTPLIYLGADEVGALSLHRLGRDSVAIIANADNLSHARVDRTGHILGVLPISGTGKFAVTRVPTLDVNAMAAGFQSREQTGAGLGVLSPRDSVKLVVAGDSLWIDYGRPGKRGRVVFGNVVPYGAVWRTGANAATQFKTSKALDFGGTVVPAGLYTLWTVPNANGWKLIINSETGQWGTEHKADKDLYTIDMKVSALPQPLERFTIGVDPADQGGVLNFDWDTTRASVPFTVKP